MYWGSTGSEIAQPAQRLPQLLDGHPMTFQSVRPIVYVTFGTLFNANLDLFRLALAALADEPVEVVMTVGHDHDPAELAPFPANARVERFIPQAELLPSCSVIVHHSGAGTTFGALAHGVPQVILPQGRRQLRTRRHVRAGRHRHHAPTRNAQPGEPCRCSATRRARRHLHHIES